MKADDQRGALWIAKKPPKSIQQLSIKQNIHDELYLLCYWTRSDVIIMTMMMMIIEVLLFLLILGGGKGF